MVVKILCTAIKYSLNKYIRLLLSYPVSSPPSSKKKCGSYCRRTLFLLLAEGLAVRALIHGRVGFVGANQDAIQGAVVLSIAMVSALLDGTFEALVCVTVHDFQPPFFEFAVSMCTHSRKQSWTNLEIIR
jgi:hypothetical protein